MSIQICPLSRLGNGAYPIATSLCLVTKSDVRGCLLSRAMAEMEGECLASFGILRSLVYYDEEPFNECKAKNLAAESAMTATDLLIFTNADISIPIEVLHVTEQLLLDDPSQLLLCQRYDEQADGTFVPNAHAIGDFQAVHRSLFTTIGGFDERMIGWGYLDYDFALRCQRVGAKVRRVCSIDGQPAFIKHFWHPRLTDKRYRSMNARNSAIGVQGHLSVQLMDVTTRPA